MQETLLERPYISENIVEVLNQIPEIEGFPTLEELNEEFAKLVDEFDCVKEVEFDPPLISQEQRPVGCFTVGDVQEQVDGEPQGRYAMLIGTPHPNEAEGVLSSLHFARLFAQNPQFFKEKFGLDGLIVVPVADPDWYERNKGWMADPTVENYVYEAARQIGRKQIEWSFPVEHENFKFTAAIPEVKNLMRVMDRYRPAIVASLHGSKQGRGYIYSTQKSERFCYGFKALMEELGVEIQTDGTEIAMCEQHVEGTAVYNTPSGAGLYDEQIAKGKTPDEAAQKMFGGGNTYDYASSLIPDVEHLITEINAFDLLIPDGDELSEHTHTQAYKKGLETQLRLMGMLRIMLASIMESEQEFDKALAESSQEYVARYEQLAIDDLQTIADANAEVLDTKKITKKQAFLSQYEISHLFGAIIFAGSTRRLAKEVGRTGTAKEIKIAVDGILAAMKRQGTLQAMPRRKTVMAQVGTVLQLAEATMPA